METPEAYVVMYRLRGSDAPAKFELARALGHAEGELEELPQAQWGAPSEVVETPAPVHTRTLRQRRVAPTA